MKPVVAASRIGLLESIEAFCPMLVLIHVVMDNARYHHAKLAQDWLSRPDRAAMGRCVMHKAVTHNKCYARCAQCADAALDFLRGKVPRTAPTYAPVTDNFHVIARKDFRVIA